MIFLSAMSGYNRWTRCTQLGALTLTALLALCVLHKLAQTTSYLVRVVSCELREIRLCREVKLSPGGKVIFKSRLQLSTSVVDMLTWLSAPSMEKQHVVFSIEVTKLKIKDCHRDVEWPLLITLYMEDLVNVNHEKKVYNKTKLNLKAHWEGAFCVALMSIRRI